MSLKTVQLSSTSSERLQRSLTNACLLLSCFILAAEIVDECLPLAVLFYLGGIQFLWHLLALWSSYRLNAQVEFADNKPVICPTVCITHSLCHSDILNEMPVLGARVHP